MSFVERGVRHEAKVDAETAYEAAVHAMKQWSGSRYIKGPRRSAVLHLEVTTRKSLTITVGQVLKWLYETPPRNADERERKTRLRNLLAHSEH